MRSIVFLLAISAAGFLTSNAQAQDAAAGEKVFNRCKACHVADKDENRVGPSLMNVIGRTAGTHPNYQYSPAMVEAGKNGTVWNDETLEHYLRNPKAMIKGTKMAFAGLKNDKDIVNVVAYLEQFSKK
ncbi:cytochrome c [Pseudaminobacter salicylatoxidans]|uniref:Cytochrome c n=1 Tax=Pseudaminobacter salicylatoxidans TaxID=93369 RepID=A0A316BV94_PSESE|nr:cytochrome c family protein [Pseudaminobacter salicylatoxidans]PWJ75810.1 cytochrome c [Pseudaminobacter salicylatoxidans]